MIALGRGSVYFYIMDTGAVIAIPTPRGFNERYVTLNDAPFFEVSGHFSEDNPDVALRTRRLFRARERILRILYVSSLDPRSADGFAHQVS